MNPNWDPFGTHFCYSLVAHHRDPTKPARELKAQCVAGLIKTSFLSPTWKPISHLFFLFAWSRYATFRHTVSRRVRSLHQLVFILSHASTRGQQVPAACLPHGPRHPSSSPMQAAGRPFMLSTGMPRAPKPSLTASIDKQNTSHPPLVSPFQSRQNPCGPRHLSMVYTQQTLFAHLPTSSHGNIVGMRKPPTRCRPRLHAVTRSALCLGYSLTIASGYPIHVETGSTQLKGRATLLGRFSYKTSKTMVGYKKPSSTGVKGLVLLAYSKAKEKRRGIYRRKGQCWGVSFLSFRWFWFFY